MSGDHGHGDSQVPFAYLPFFMSICVNSFVISQRINRHDIKQGLRNVSLRSKLCRFLCSFNEHF